MPEGDTKEAPSAPVYASEWTLGPPDLVLEVDSPMQVPAEGTDLFRNFVLPVPLTETRWVRAMEIKPGSPGVVHHANGLIDRTASLRRAHPTAWKQGIPGMDVTLDAGDRSIRTVTFWSGSRTRRRWWNSRGCPGVSTPATTWC